MTGIRTRFAPAPSGDLHVGNVRTGLFSWAVARHAGGKFVYRIEDTDATRATDEAFHAAVDVLRWLGIDWDEGPVVGGPHEPYRQSERFEVYAGVVAQLQESGHAYPCFCTPEEITARKAARGDKTPGYDGFCRDRTDHPDGPATMRFRMPEGSTTWDDLVRGDITIDHKDVPDFTIMRSNGHPLYMLAATVDDVLMGMTHIVRGEDLIAATPRQMAMYAAMGVPRESFPAFGHLPLIVGEDSKPLSKRNGEVSIAWYRRNGFLPEAMLNYLALLGWSMPGTDEEVFTVDEMVAAFDVSRVSKNPARFDLKKLEAINGEHIRRLSEGDLAARLLPVLQDAGVLGDVVPEDAHETLRSAIPLVQTRLARLTEAPDLLRFLFAGDAFEVDGAAAAKTLLGETVGSLDAALRALEALPSWDAASIEAALRAALVDGLGLKPKHAFGPLRVAVTGRTISPPLFESMELVGRDVTLARLRSAIVDVRGF
ncbi:MAG: glutamyl-tRNA synthetase [Frankiaceae bacterium]|jgi:glutamyl-tRNA synthetase|nr:glutamyl-tRNA synthetase [Frankiaceae bacterium]